MEHNPVKDFLVRVNRFRPEIAEKLNKYAILIHEINRKFNVTGFKNPGDIMNHLIIDSIKPLCDIKVPRGTSFVDIGSGAGIPGIPLSIIHDNLSGVLIEANHKKAGFLKDAIAELKLDNLSVINERAEDIIKKPGFRESYDWAFARAFGDLYLTMEIGIPFIKPEGFLYIYSNLRLSDIPVEIISHANELGGNFVDNAKRYDFTPSEGLLLEKEKITPTVYPRRFAVIKRESKKAGGL